MHKITVRFFGFLGVWLVLLGAPPAKAAQLQLVPNWGASGVPTNLSMYVYVPDSVVANPPILVLLHYWGGGASGVFAEAQAGGIVAAADQFGFIMVVPERPDCWDANSPQTLTHDGGGDSQGIAQMVRYAITNYHANSNRVYVTGTSCGAMMTEVMLAVYPDVFKAGAAFAGQAVGGAWTPISRTPQQWGNIVRNAYSGYSGPRPRVQLWHGTADGTINYSNQVESIAQWGNVLGLSTNPTSSNMVTILTITNQWIHQVWQDSNSNKVLDAWSEINGGHGTDANLNARYVIPFLGIDKAGPLDAGAGGQRARPHLNAARTTFVADNGQPLRGPYTSTEWTGATSYDQIAKVKSLGFNAVHLYGESFDINYPNPGSTAPGYAASRIDSIVASTRDLGLYLMITIGNGANNGNYNRAYVTNFWKFYSARYANETHVLFEIQNEPVAWGPPYSSPTATPPGALDMEVATYKTIRANAPDTPVLLFSYAVLGGTGGANSALTDIHAFNQAVFGNQNAVWTNCAVGFHGYAGAKDNSIAVSNLISAGYPCMMTEFATGTWGGGPGGLDVEAVANLERLKVSWLTFQYIPPSGVSDDITRPDAYSNRVVNAGLSWTPDYGSFPVARSVYGNGGYPWTTADVNNNVLNGTLRIEAENFDNGGKSVAYYNTNSSNPGGQYRLSETVGIGTTSDAGGGYNVGWTSAGDWLEYTMKITVAGTYNLRLRVAGTSAGRVQLTANATDLTGEWTLPNTGGVQTWTTVTKSVFLTPGQQKLRLNILAGGFNLNWIEISPSATGPIANGTYKILNAASAMALDLATNTVITTNSSSAVSQRWNLQHIGGGLYQVTSVGNGGYWSTWAGPLHTVGWRDGYYIFLPTGGGFYRCFSASGGSCFAPSVGTPPTLDEETWVGAADQQWAVSSPSAPAFPVGLGATATSATQIVLTWKPVSGATSYNIKRSNSSGGPYTTLATGVAATNYTDAVISGIRYYYVVSAVAGVTESANSLETTVNPPYPWATRDIGSVGSAGGVTFDDGTFTVRGSGADIWGTADAFRFVYLPVSGNCTNIARVVSVQNSDGWAKAGVMIRASLAANSAHAFVAVTPGNGVAWQYRSTAGGNSSNNNTPGYAAPFWVKLVRIGSNFTGYRSPDGTNWTQIGTTSIGMAATVYVGLAVTAHNNSSLCAATFDNVTVQPGWLNWTAPLAPVSLLATAGSGQASLTWPASSAATGYNVKRATKSGGPYLLVANIATTNYTDTGLINGTNYFYVVSALNPAGESSDSDEISVTPQVLAPTGLAATTISSSQIHLIWNPLADATGYNVKRSIINGGPYTTIATGVATTDYQDAGLAGGTVYYYVVSAMVAGNETDDSAAATATTISSTLGSLVHRYSFGESGGSIVADSVGGPIWSGTLPNGGTLTSGQLALSPGSQQYVRLPAGIVASMSNATVMAWVNLSSVSYWSRIFDFGNDANTYLFLTPRNGFNYTARFGISTSGAFGEQDVNAPVAIETGDWHQVTVTMNSGTGILYLDGVAVGTNASMTISPLSLGNTVNNYIGRSQSGSEPYLDGSLDEFRIYNAALSSAEIAASLALGPNQILSTNEPVMNLALTETNLMLSWPVENAGFTLQSCTNLASGEWLNVTSPAPQITGNQWRVLLSPSAETSGTFYRLMK